MGSSLFAIDQPDGADQSWISLKNRAVPVNAPLRQQLEFWWTIYEPYADADFRNEFARHLDQRFWEMLLTCFLLHHGKELVPRSKRPRKGPDILVEEAGRRIWIEAVVLTPGDREKPDTVPESQADGSVHNVPTNQLRLRASNALKTKRAAFCRYQDEGIVQTDDLCVIAINTGALKFGSKGIENVVYPNTQWAGRREWLVRGDIPKNSGARVEMVAFARPRYKHIAGVVFSGSTPAVAAGRQPLDVRYFANPNSSQALQVGWVPWTEETSVEERNGEPVVIYLNAKGTETSCVWGGFPVLEEGIEHPTSQP